MQHTLLTHCIRLLPIALIQGILLWVLTDRIEHELWPYQRNDSVLWLYSMLLVAPTLLLFGLVKDQQHAPINKAMVASCALTGAWFIGMLGLYVGFQNMPFHYASELGLVFFVFSMALLSFKFLMYLHYISTGKSPTAYIALKYFRPQLDYQFLLKNAWQDILCFGLALVFTGAVWIVLALWMNLFALIEINYFTELFTSRGFAIPMTTLAFAFGVILVSSMARVITTIANLVQLVVKFLLPVVITMLIMFMLALPIKGLAVFWENGGSVFILGLQAVTLFFVNVVYKDEPWVWPYPVFMHRYVYAGLTLLPVYSAISGYGLTLRIMQYGWTVARVYAVVLMLVLALFACGYLWAIVRQRDWWPQHQSQVNVWGGLVLLACAVLLNSILLDPRKIATASQLARLDSGAVMLEDFDLSYIRFHLARPGYLALQQLKEDLVAADTAPDVVLEIESLYRRTGEAEPFAPLTAAELQAKLNVVSGEPPAPLLETIRRVINDDLIDRNPWVQYHLLPVDLDANGPPEYLLMADNAAATRVKYDQFYLFYQTDPATAAGEQAANGEPAPDAAAAAARAVTESTDTTEAGATTESTSEAAAEVGTAAESASEAAAAGTATESASEAAAAGTATESANEAAAARPWQFQQLSLSPEADMATAAGKAQRAERKAALLSGEFQLHPPRWNFIEVGDQLLHWPSAQTEPGPAVE